MTVSSLVVSTIISQALFVVTKVLFLHYLNMDNVFIYYLFYIVLIIETIAVIRRIGVINYLESFLLMIVWLIALLLVDIVVTATLIGHDMYHHMYYWLGNLFIILAILLFHKALHVEVRKSNAHRK